LSGCFQEVLSGADEILTAITGERPANNLISVDIGYAVVGNPVTNTKGHQKLNQIASAFIKVITKNLFQIGFAKPTDPND
jgi:hypothetical protein